MPRLFRTCLGLGGLLLLGGCDPAARSDWEGQPYLARKAAFQTILTKSGKAPQEYQELRSDSAAALVEYPSGPLRLKGLLLRTTVDSARRRPALVYLHGGFALGPGDLADCAPFAQAGYVVFAPAYRAENGNPGNFTLFWHEVDDARAAVRWLARQPYVDSTRIYVFGHSIGGGVSGLLTLQAGVPMRLSGSSGGLYEASFAGWDDIVPYDQTNLLEGRMRVLRDNLPWMRYPHVAYLGLQDEGFAPEIPDLQRRVVGTKLTVKPMPGDHFSSLEPAMQDFLRVIDESQRQPAGQ
jgi:hypothetical protein